VADAAWLEQGVTTPLERPVMKPGWSDSKRFRSPARHTAARITLTFRGGNPEGFIRSKRQNEASWPTRACRPRSRAGGNKSRRSSDDLLDGGLSFSARRGAGSKPAFLKRLWMKSCGTRCQRVPGVGQCGPGRRARASLAFRSMAGSQGSSKTRGLTISDVVDALCAKAERAGALGQVAMPPSPENQETTFPLRLEGRLRSVLNSKAGGRQTPNGGGVRLRR